MNELGEVLRAWRERVRPEQVGLPAGPGRRAVGLRRAEVSTLAGVSVEYLVRLEQGRARRPSPEVLGALARALHLTEDERDHLYRVGGVAVPGRGLVPSHIGPGVRRVVDRLGDLPLAVVSASWDLLWWNPLWAAIGGDPSTDRGPGRNVAWRHFVLGPGAISYDAAHAEEFSADLAADLREALGRYPRDPDLSGLIDRLRTTSADFRRHWGAARVARHRSSSKTATHTPVGPVTVDCDVLAVPGSDLRIVVYTAAPGSEDASKLDLLRVTGLQEIGSGRATHG